MSFSAFISNRLSLRSNGRRRPAPAIIVAVGGIALSLAVMLLAVAVVTGFKNEIKRKVMGFDAQISVHPFSAYYGSAWDSPGLLCIDDVMTDVLADALEAAGTEVEPEVAVTLQQTGMVKTENDFMGVLFKSYGSGYRWGFERGNLVEGKLPVEENPRGVMISEAMASRLRLALGDKINVYFFGDGNVRPRRYEVTGIYCSNFGEYDNLVAYAPHKALAGLMKCGDDEGERIEIRGLDEPDITAVADRLQSNLMERYSTGQSAQAYAVSTVFASGAMYFNWLDMLDTNIVVILILMGCVSGFMLVSCVLILILERVRMVGILKALGATNRQTGMIFVRLGARVTAIGLAAGNLLGLSVILAQAHWHVVPLDPASYYLSYVPVELTFVAWLLINAGAALFSFLLMLLPAATVSRLSPVKVMRFE